jgi:hypothetical protein
MSLNLGGPWYSSGTFWAIVSVAVAAIGIIVVATLTWRVANPKRRLIYSLLSTASLVPEEHGLNLQVLLDEAPLLAPRVLVIRLSYQGHRDIETSSFDELGELRRQPLRIDTGAQIIKILKVRPEGAIWPDPQVDGTTLAIGPGRIGHNQHLVISLLVDGSTTQLTCPNPPLLNIEIEEQRPEDTNRKLKRLSTASETALLAVTVAITLLWVFGVR